MAETWFFEIIQFDSYLMAMSMKWLIIGRHNQIVTHALTDLSADSKLRVFLRGSPFFWSTAEDRAVRA